MEEVRTPGFRFYPTEEELLQFYLHNKLRGKRLDELHRVIPLFNIYELDPWHLPREAGELCNEDKEQWFFFTARQEREANGGRPNRITSSGYWKATGSPCYVYSSDSHVIGLKKTMVFYKGKAPTGRKTKWKMNEYRAIEGGTSATPMLRHEFCVCRIYITSGFLRSFDRRPSAATTSETPVQPGHNDQVNVPTTSTTTATMAAHEGLHVAQRSTSSPDCSSLGDDSHHLSPLWEFEQMNWFLGDQLDLT
ncbi:hypothetical protein Sjap_012432 [Stephania japonica]|uniref:NAC domain-containing protein n=1 Tax=Stephania japonica TaxID=461633 RepID=A0AAP0NYW7_9MAGN